MKRYLNHLFNYVQKEATEIKRVGIIGVQITLVLALVLSTILNIATVVSAEHVNEVEVMYHTHYNHDIAEDNFTSSQVTGCKSWATSLQNLVDVTGSGITNTTLDLTSDLIFKQFEPEPSLSNPPDYQWSLGDVDEGAESMWVNISPADYSVTFSPQFHASRGVDKTTFTGENTQIITINATPLQVMGTLFLSIQCEEDKYVNPTIISTAHDPEVGVYISDDGHRLQIRIRNPVSGATYTQQVTIKVIPKVSEIEFMPEVTVFYFHEKTEIPAGDMVSSISYEVAELGTWTWSTPDNYIWRQEEGLIYNVHFNGYSRPLVNSAVTWQVLTGVVVGVVITGLIVFFFIRRWRRRAAW